MLPEAVLAEAPGCLALGVLDEEVLPHLEATLRVAGVPVFNPALKPVARHAAYHLVRDLLRLAESCSCTC
jgi:hypothetical protein